MTNPPILVRAMETEDLRQVAVLCAQLGYPSTEAQVAERFARLSASARDAMFVACRSDAVLGWIHVYVSGTLESDAHVEIGGLIVDRAARGTGVGRQLMAEAERWAATQRCARVRLRSNVVRAEAHAFYERLGYRRLKTQYTFEKSIDSSR